MKHYLYDLKTGIFSGSHFSGHTKFIIVPEGQGEFIGDADPLSQRVDLATGLLVDYQPPKPEDTVHTAYEWEPGMKRWAGKPTLARLAATVRADRHARLAACDWVVIRARETFTAIPPEWSDYREALRDITGQPGFPGSVIWPVSPS